MLENKVVKNEKNNEKKKEKKREKKKRKNKLHPGFGWLFVSLMKKSEKSEKVKEKYVFCFKAGQK